MNFKLKDLIEINVTSLITEFWVLIFESSFSVVSKLNILVIYQLARYPQCVVHFGRCPVSRRIYDLIFRNHSVCYVSSYFILCIRYDNWGSFDSLDVIYAVLSLMIILLQCHDTYSISSWLLTFFDCSNLRDSYLWNEAPWNDKSSANCSRYLSIPSSILVGRVNSHSYFLALHLPLCLTHGSKSIPLTSIILKTHQEDLRQGTEIWFNFSRNSATYNCDLFLSSNFLWKDSDPFCRKNITLLRSMETTRNHLRVSTRG